MGGIDELNDIYDAVEVHVTNDIWVGKMNKIDERIHSNDEKLAKFINFVKREQTDSKIAIIYNEYKNNPLISWKDSIKEVMKLK